MTTILHTIAAAALVVACAATAAAQTAAPAASSPTWFLVAADTGPGGASQSFTHALCGTLAAGAPAARALSTSFVLLGGFPAAVDAPATGQPWLAGVEPAFAPLLGGTALVLHGTELALGPTPAITVGGVVAPVGGRTNATIATVLPPQPQPGWQPVTVQGPFGSTTLPRGVGVLPLLDLPVAHQDDVPVALRYVGAPGDIVVFGVAAGTGPVPLPIAPYHHGLLLDLATVFVLTAEFVVAPDGVFALQLPALAPTSPILFQCLALTLHPGYAPGAFTNVVAL
jgi:hypothetical protein